MKLDVSGLKGLAQKLFEAQSQMVPLWQTLAEHFYPERADFTLTRAIGDELADNLVDSYPVLIRRDLGNSLSAMLRDGEWFQVGINGEPDHVGQMWLQWATKRMMRLMDVRASNFTRATKEGDHDYVTFGQPILTVERNRLADGLLYRSWHPRDCAWWDGEDGQIEGVARKGKMTMHNMVRYFGEDKVSETVRKEVSKTPFKEINTLHMMLPSSMYGDDQIESRFPWVSVSIDETHTHMMEETGMNHKMYIIPRFQTVSGSPYAYSPATVVGLPDARALQAMTHTLLEAGERYTRPPLIATKKAIRSDVDLSSDGITWIDREYDERLGAALRPLQQDRGGYPIGVDARASVVDVLASAFYLNKIALPETTREMTAYEVAERMKQYRRENLPLFAPIESEYSGQLCETSFEVAFNSGFLGSPMDVPESLRGRDVRFEFISPLTDSEEEKKANRFSQVAQMLSEAAQHDPNVAMEVNVGQALRDAVTGVGAPQRWLNDVAQVAQGRQAAAAQQMMMAAAQSGALEGSQVVQ
jgi:hypothetical protein